jgi:hypothetical protein
VGRLGRRPAAGRVLRAAGAAGGGEALAPTRSGPERVARVWGSRRCTCGGDDRRRCEAGSPVVDDGLGGLLGCLRGGRSARLFLGRTRMFHVKQSSRACSAPGIRIVGRAGHRRERTRSQHEPPGGNHGAVPTTDVAGTRTPHPRDWGFPTATRHQDGRTARMEGRGGLGCADPCSQTRPGTVQDPASSCPDRTGWLGSVNRRCDGMTQGRASRGGVELLMVHIAKQEASSPT